MGINYSHIKERFDKTEIRYKSILVLTRYLYDEYNKIFVKSNFCEEIIKEYNKRNIVFENKVYNELGLSKNEIDLFEKDKISDEKLCEVLKNKYNTQLYRINKIKDKCELIRNRILSLVKGPRCVDNVNIFNKEECVKTGSVWKENIVTPNPNIDLNKIWYNNVDLLINTYNKGLKFVIGYLKILLNKNTTLYIMNSTINMITTELVKIDKITDEYYLNILNIKTFTEQDILQLKQENQAIYEALKKATTVKEIVTNK